MEQPHSHTAGHAFTSFPGQCIGKQKEDKVNNKDLTPLWHTIMAQTPMLILVEDPG
jgi:hypothetical protein